MSPEVISILQQLWATVARLGPREVIDLVVVGFFFYQLLKLFKGTQATQLIVGLALLGLLGVVSVALHLILLSWLFQNAASVIVIAVIVLFQPELRRMLDQIGRVPHLGGTLTVNHGQLSTSAAAESLRAIERFSRRHNGALIAFQKEVGLEDYAESGVRLNAELSAELLQSIFFPTSPLHDGAVIVQGSTILAAGCLLPLPEEGSVRERLGTRHRAALGLSLVSDALIVVVSEETGIVSVAENGSITTNLDALQLQSELATILDPPLPIVQRAARIGRPRARRFQAKFAAIRKHYRSNQ
ncbi:MAG: diadenylate cyclase CdaA [Candidatus Dormibacteraceae bacterium]